MNNVDRINHLFQKFAEKTKLSDNAYLIAISFIVGIATGLGAFGFRWLILTCKSLFFGHGQQWLIPLIPMFGGVLVGPIVYFYAREAKGHGVPEVMAAVALKSGLIRPRVAAAKAVASAICIGSGGSAGREGPIIQIGAAIGSIIAQVFKLSGERMKVLVGCGAAAGISAVFNAPIAGMIFALEIILGDFTISTFSPVILSSVLSSVVSRTLLRDHPVLDAHPYTIVTAWEIGFYIVLGILAGLIAVLFTKSLYLSEDIFDKKIKLPVYLKPALGGLLLGLIGLLAARLNYEGFVLTAPAVFSDGYESISAVLENRGVLPTITILIFLKILATDLTLGSGNSGGIFAPSLFMGAMTGGAFGMFVHQLFPTITANPGAYALVGMAAVVAGTTHATLTSIIIVFEMTNDYRIMLALMVACVFATLVSRRIMPYSIYTLKLKRKGIELVGGKDTNILELLKVNEIIRKDYKSIPINARLGQIYEIFGHTSANSLPVFDTRGQFYGILSLHNLRSVMAKPVVNDLIIASDIADSLQIYVEEQENLRSALSKFNLRDSDILPVVSSSDKKTFVGILYKQDLLNFYNRRLLGESKPG